MVGKWISWKDVNGRAKFDIDIIVAWSRRPSLWSSGGLPAGVWISETNGGCIPPRFHHKNAAHSSLCMLEAGTQLAAGWEILYFFLSMESSDWQQSAGGEDRYPLQVAKVPLLPLPNYACRSFPQFVA